MAKKIKHLERKTPVRITLEIDAADFEDNSMTLYEEIPTLALAAYDVGRHANWENMPLPVTLHGEYLTVTVTWPRSWVDNGMEKV
jgi:hypothetical protein